MHRGQRGRHGGDGLHGHADHQGFTGGDAALETAGVVSRPREPVAFEHDGVVHLAAVADRSGPAVAELHRLHGLDGEHGLGDAAVELAVAVDVRTQPHRHAGGHDLDDPADGVAARAGGVDGLDEPLRRFGIQRADLALIGQERERLGVAAVQLGLDLLGAGGLCGADAAHVRADADAQLPEQRAGTGAERHAGGGLARAGPLEDVAHVGGVAVLERAREIGVPGPRDDERLGIRPAGADAHALGPVGPVAVADHERHRRAQRLAEANAREELRLVLLDFHAAAAAVAHLPAREVAVDVGGEERHARGQPLDDPHQRGAVALTGGQVAQPAHRASGARSAWRRSASAGLTSVPVQCRS